MESKGSFFILLIVVAVLTLALAALAGYLFLVAGAPQQGKAETNEVSSEHAVVPKEDLEELPLFEGKKYFNLKNEDPKKIAVLQVNVVLEYNTKVKIKGVKSMEEEMKHYEAQFRELVGTYFMDVTLTQISTKEGKLKAKEDLKKLMNELIQSGHKEKIEEEVIHEVFLDDYFYQ